MKTKIKTLLCFVISLSITCSLLQGQISQKGTPYSWDPQIKVLNTNRGGLSNAIPNLKMPEVPQDEINRIKRNADNNSEVQEFAYSFPVKIDVKQESVMDRLENGMLYRMSISSPGAASLNLIFSSYNIPIGAKLFLYNPNRSEMLGAFTSFNNKRSGRLPTMPVAGEQIIIEYFEPYFGPHEGRLIVGKVSHDVLGAYGTSRGYEDSGDCQVDIECLEGNDWQTESKAVCKILLNGNDHCTGALMNNSSLDGTPYILTADHCINTQSDAEDCCFVFNYKNDYCTGGEGTTTYTVAGADLISNWAATDFALLKMSAKPINWVSPYYAGYSTFPGDNGVGIHHPSGDVKKISTYPNEPQLANCVAEFGLNPSDYWLIDDWSSTINGHSVMEHGSSGSPLFSDDGYVIGQLRGVCEDGNYECDNPSLQQAVYGRMIRSLDGGGTPSTRLIDWLSPNVGAFILEGENICGLGVEYNWNISHTIPAGETLVYQATQNVTADNLIKAGAHVQYKAGEKINLLPGFHAEPGSYFNAKIEELECVPGCYAINVTNWTSYVCQGEPLEFIVNNATQFSVSIYTVNGALVAQNSGGIAGNNLDAIETNGITPGIYSVLVSFSNNCLETSNSYSLLIEDCSLNAPENGFDKTANTTAPEAVSHINIYPNPTSDITKIEFEVLRSDLVDIGLLDIKGRTVKQVESNSALTAGLYTKSLDLTHFPSGVYFLKVRTMSGIQIEKIVVE